LNTSIQVGEALNEGYERPRKSYWWHAFRVLSWLTSMHLFVAAQIWPAVGSLTAIVYLVFPPAISFLTYDLIRIAPVFAIGTIACAIALAGILWPVLIQANRALWWWLRIPFGLSCAIWLPIMAGESLRLTLMHSAALDAQAECFGTSTLTRSLRERWEFEALRTPHAWMIRNGEYWHWSYRSLRFERDESHFEPSICPGARRTHSWP
jgi:hypothetical protein